MRGTPSAEPTIQINRSLTRPVQRETHSTFASAFRRDRSVGPKRLGGSAG